MWRWPDQAEIRIIPSLRVRADRSPGSMTQLLSSTTQQTMDCGSDGSSDGSYSQGQRHRGARCRRSRSKARRRLPYRGPQTHGGKRPHSTSQTRQIFSTFCLPATIRRKRKIVKPEAIIEELTSADNDSDGWHEGWRARDAAKERDPRVHDKSMMRCKPAQANKAPLTLTGADQRCSHTPFAFRP